VIVFLDGGTIRSIANGRGSKDTARSAGEAAFVPHNPDPHTEEAVGGSLRAVIVELK
jgi:hypothetical protein